jgi:RNA polymerase sigma factor (sigma-70 family)
MAETDDFVQDTLIKTFKRIDVLDLERTGALQAYLREAVLNRIRSEIRRHGRQPARQSLDNAMPATAGSPLELAIGRQAVERYERALASLREEERRVVIGRIEMGHTYEELAAILGKPSADAANGCRTGAPEAGGSHEPWTLRGSATWSDEFSRAPTSTGATWKPTPIRTRGARHSSSTEAGQPCFRRSPGARNVSPRGGSHPGEHRDRGDERRNGHDRRGISWWAPIGNGAQRLRSATKVYVAADLCCRPPADRSEQVAGTLRSYHTGLGTPCT